MLSSPNEPESDHCWGGLGTQTGGQACGRAGDWAAGTDRQRDGRDWVDEWVDGRVNGQMWQENGIFIELYYLHVFGLRKKTLESMFA